VALIAPPPETDSPFANLVAHARHPLVWNALVLILNSGLAAGLGFVFWALAARLYSAEQLGLASAAISSALFVATLTQFGLPYALVRFAPPDPHDRAVLATTVVAAGAGAAALGGILFVVGLDVWATELVGFVPLPVLALGLASLAAATCASTVLVFVAVGARDTRPALIGGIAHGAVKAGMVTVFAIMAAGLGFGILVAWLIGTLAAVGVQAWWLRANLAARVNFGLLRLGSFLHYSAGNYIGDLAWSAPALLLPLVVLSTVGAEANAYFFVAWSIASLLVAIPTAIANSLLAEGSHTGSDMGAHFRRAFRMTLIVMLPATALWWVFAPLLLGLFGPSYASEGVDTLRVLSLGALPLGVVLLYLTRARVHREMRRVLVITSVTGGSALVLGAVLVGSAGATGAALGFLIANTIVAAALVLESWLFAGPTDDPAGAPLTSPERP
jgi:O-antigen/teichoic acid export membrane protein